MSDHAEAAAVLAGADRAAEAARQAARWYARYLTIFGAATVAAVSVLYWIEGSTAGTFWIAACALFVAAISRYAARQPVHGCGLRRQHLTILGVWFALYGAMLSVGLEWFETAWWWPLSGVVVALPAFAGACWVTGQ